MDETLKKKINALCDEFVGVLSTKADALAFAPFLDQIDHGARRALLAALVVRALEWLQTSRHADGIDAADRLLAANPEIVDELEPLLSRAAETIRHADAAANPVGGLQVRCPHCGTPIALIIDAELSSVHCPSCGSDFGLVDDEEAETTRHATGITHVAHFKLVERVGMGAFGAVWKAHDTKLDRTVAVKLPRMNRLDARMQKLLMREAQNAAQLSHPGVVPVYEVGREGDTLYVVSEFVRGLTLGDWLTGQHPSSREAAELCRKIAEALQHAHERGVVHRDLKPDNVMLHDPHGSGSFEPRLMDFGLARREAAGVTMTTDGQVLGTPAYMSPEQARGESHQADARSDVYSLGVVLFELLTGERPFRGNARMLIHQVVNDEPPNPRKLNGSVPKDLETVVLKCLEKDPERRYPTAGEVAAELRRWLAGEPIAARPLGRFQRGARWCRRNPQLATLYGVIVSTLLATAVGATAFGVRESALRSSLDKLNSDLRYKVVENVMARADSVYRDGATDEAIARLSYAGDLLPPGDRLRGPISDLLGVWSNERLSTIVHDKRVNGTAFSPDGTVFATASYDGTALLWDLKSERPLCEPLQHEGAVYSVAFSPDGKIVATSASSGNVHLWDSKNGSPLLETLKHPTAVRSVAFHGDSQKLVTGCDDGRLRIWDWKKSKMLLDWSGTQGEAITKIAVSPTRNEVAVACFEGTVSIWNLDDGANLVPPIQQAERTYSVAYSADGSKIASHGSRESLKVWEREGMKELPNVATNGWPYSITFGDSSDQLVIGYLAGRVDTVQIDPWRVEKTVRLNAGSISSVSYLSKGGLIGVGTMSRLAMVVPESASSRVVGSFRSHNLDPCKMAISRDGLRIAVANQKGELAIVDLANDRANEIEFGETQEIKFLGFGSRRDAVYIVGDRKLIKLDLEEGGSVDVDSSLDGIFFDVSQNDSDLLLSSTLRKAGEKASLAILRKLDGEELSQWKVEGPIKDARFVNNDQWVACLYTHNSLDIYESHTGNRIAGPLDFGSGAYALAVTPNGPRVALAGDDISARVWTIGTDRVRQILLPTKVCGSLEFSPDARFILSGSETASGAMLFESQTGRVAKQLTNSPVVGVCWSPDSSAAYVWGANGDIVQHPVPARPDIGESFESYAHKKTGLRAAADDSTDWMSQAEWLRGFDSHPRALSESSPRP